MNILFYTSNGVGLGHLRRASLIANRLRAESKNIKIILVTLAPAPHIFGKFSDNLVQLAPLSDELLKNPSEMGKVCLANGRIFAKAIKKFKPDLVVADFHLSSPFAFYPLSCALGQIPAEGIFIWRLEDKKSFRRDLEKEAVKLSYFKKIILPHDREELKDLLPIPLFKKIKSNSKFEICGPILRKLDKNKIISCRRKYRISSNDFLITLTTGAGGRLMAGRCETPDKIIKSFLAVYPQLAKAIPALKAVIITGLYFPKTHFGRSYGELKIIKFEKNLPELMHLSKLVISAAGYNTCNELIQAKTPAILIPLLRGNYEQFERASYFERKGVARVFEDGSSREFLNLIIDCRNNLNKMKLNFKKFSDWEQGKEKVAGIILKVLNEK